MKPLISPLFNKILLFFAYLTLIAGPTLALFDHSDYDKKDPDAVFRHSLHMLGAKVFTLGHIVYTFSVIQVLSNNKEKFEKVQM